MSTTSTNFHFVLATTSDPVNVVTQIANNFSSLDSILSICHTGTGQFKSGLLLISPTLSGATISGVFNANTVAATAGVFSTVTATAGYLVVSTFGIGNYIFDSTAGANGNVLTVVTGNARWAVPAPGTGAASNLSNLAAVVINTNLNTFSAGFVTFARIVATSGNLTAFTAITGSTGKFNVLTVTGTLTADVINVTGGNITAGGFAIGTYSYPTTRGTTGQVLTMTTNNARWIVPNLAQTAAYFAARITSGGTAVIVSDYANVVFEVEELDTSNQYDPATGIFSVTASGYYQFGIHLGVVAAGAKNFYARLTGGTSVGSYFMAYGAPASGTQLALSGSVLVLASSGESYRVQVYADTAGNAGQSVVVGTSTNFSRFWGMKVPDR